jgi:hypothetical protein
VRYRTKGLRSGCAASNARTLSQRASKIVAPA